MRLARLNPKGFVAQGKSLGKEIGIGQVEAARSRVVPGCAFKEALRVGKMAGNIRGNLIRAATIASKIQNEGTNAGGMESFKGFCHSTSNFSWIFCHVIKMNYMVDT